MYRQFVSEYFKKQSKSLVRKYPSLRKSIKEALTGFDKSKSDSLGKNLFKLRLRADEIQRGKNKSFRLIVVVVEHQKAMSPVALYFKGDSDNISKKELKHHLGIVLLELDNL